MAKAKSSAAPKRVVRNAARVKPCAAPSKAMPAPGAAAPTRTNPAPATASHSTTRVAVSMPTDAVTRPATNPVTPVVPTKPVTFTCKAAPGSRVFVAGTFNEWNPASHELCTDDGSDVFSAAFPLPQGRHEYKLVVNDQWLFDPRSSAWVLNAHGSLNSVLLVE